MAFKYDYSPTTLSILRALDLSSPFSMFLEGHQNVTSTCECWHFVKGKINGVFRALRKYSKEYYEDEIGVISDVVFDLIEGYHGITDKSDYLSLQIQLHLRDHVQNKLLKIPIILGWIETICVVAIYISFICDVSKTIQITAFYAIFLSILALALFLHTCGIIWQYFVYCNPRSYINPFPSKILYELLTTEHLGLIKYACLMKWMNIVQYNTSMPRLRGLTFIIIQKYIVPFVICVAALCVPSEKYDQLFLIVNGIILPFVIWCDAIFKIVRYKRNFWKFFAAQYLSFFCLQLPYWLDLPKRIEWNAFIICYNISCVLTCFLPKSLFYSNVNQYAPAFMRETDTRSHWQIMSTTLIYELKDIRGSYEVFVCRYLLYFGALQSVYISSLYFDAELVRLVVMTFCKIIALGSLFLYHCAKQIKLLQIYNEKCLSYSKQIYLHIMKGVVSTRDRFQFQRMEQGSVRDPGFTFI